MKTQFALYFLLYAFAAGTAVVADNITQVTGPAGGVTTTVESPTGTMHIATSFLQSVVTHPQNGTTFEIDSDNSVYMVYPDGARVTAPNGVHTLLNGETIAVKDGKRIP